MTQMRSKNFQWRQLSAVLLFAAGCHFPESHPVLKPTVCSCSPDGPCAGFAPTCWRQWPSECAMCPPLIEPEPPADNSAAPGALETLPPPDPAVSKTSQAPLGSPTGSHRRGGGGSAVGLPRGKPAQVNFRSASAVGQGELAPAIGMMRPQLAAVPAQGRPPMPELTSVTGQTLHVERRESATESQVLLRGSEPTKRSKWKEWSIPKILPIKSARRS